ncbi:ribosome-binding factor A [Leptospirillum ferriphilum]|jgi:ribosome-binding factor A|uniref:Ribosome-binding factor A n=2 Tax=Leptospirillum TaxID=179 RepID=A0A094W5Z2_9BACT|nr:ribosome-binding factor A [Leptospirillum ferriphilum]EDZ38685.1 MAG: Probable ribosome-binding factor A [Leptospirillum sp. Group II '5-way CG']KGA92888.1 putative ribosome binding factor A [Leptospirillum ferriphilum]
MKPVYRRADRVSSEIREIVALVLSRFSAEPALGRLTILYVNLPDDLKVARIHYSVFPGEDPHYYGRLLTRHKGLIRKEVGKLLRMKWVPDIEFLPSLEIADSDPQSDFPVRQTDKDKKNTSSLMDELEGEQ